MNLDHFKQRPMTNMHNAYQDGFFHMFRAPENASGEVILASLYRKIGLKKIGEGMVTETGKKFSTRLKNGERTNPFLHTGLGDNIWEFILERVLGSPKAPKQPKKKFIQLTPIVPDATLYSFAARHSGSPWNPGALIESIVGYGCNTQKDADEMWTEIFKALSIDKNDDIWARFISQEFRAWRSDDIKWEINKFNGKCRLERNDRMKHHLPAKRFMKDMSSLLSLKQKLTRRQWISLLESLVRLGTASHILWICDVNDRIWYFFKQSLNGTPPPEIKEIGEKIMSVKKGFWRYGESAISLVKEKAREYITARIGINYVLCFIESLVESGELPEPSRKFEKLEDVHRVCQYLFENKKRLKHKELFSEISLLLEKDPRLLSCSSGITSNLVEFLRYSLGQRQTIDEETRNYDQGYWLKKKGNYSSAPWILAAGPVSLMAMAYCCSKRSSAPRTIDDFCRHLGEYGITINPVDLSSSGLIKSLRDLGLVIDSPDAEGGMVVLNPFKREDC